MRYNNLYLKFLKLLSKRGLGFESDVTLFLAKYFPRNGVGLLWDQPNLDMVEFLKQMQKDGNIEYTITKLDRENSQFKDFKISASITKEGMDFLKRQKFTWTIIWTAIGTIIAVLTFYFTVVKKLISDTGEKKPPAKEVSQPSRSKQKTIKSIPKTSVEDSSRK